MSKNYAQDFEKEKGYRWSENIWKWACFLEAKLIERDKEIEELKDERRTNG